MVDTLFTTGSVAGEIIANIVTKKFNSFEVSYSRLAMPDVPEPTSFGLTRGFILAQKISLWRL